MAACADNASRGTVRAISVGKITLHVTQSGRPDGPPLVLLHGFPDYSGAWRPLLDELNPRLRAIVPDLRGYGRSARPNRVVDYQPSAAIGDVIGLLDGLGIERAVLCGNDWGGVLAGWTAMYHSDRVSGLVLINSAPPDVLQTMIWDHPEQRRRSQYLTLLRSPEANTLFREDNVDALIERFLGIPYRTGHLTEEDIAGYRAMWTQNGAWEAMLAWYSAAPIEAPPPEQSAPVRRWTEDLPPIPQVPVCVIWGERDEVFVPDMPDQIGKSWNCRDVVRLPDAGHVPFREQPARCAAIIDEFMCANVPAEDLQK